MLGFNYIHEPTYNISPAIELNSSIFSFVIILRASWSFDSTTGSAKRMINVIKHSAKASKILTLTIQ